MILRHLWILVMKFVCQPLAGGSTKLKATRLVVMSILFEWREWWSSSWSAAKLWGMILHKLKRNTLLNTSLKKKKDNRIQTQRQVAHEVSSDSYLLHSFWLLI
jgi:hypothetical protein